jgi:hypothetical protein
MYPCLCVYPAKPPRNAIDSARVDTPDSLEASGHLSMGLRPPTRAHITTGRVLELEGDAEQDGYD